MTLSEILRDDVLDDVSRYLSLKASEDVRKRLVRAVEAAAAVEGLLNLEELDKDADKLRKAREVHTRTRLLEKLTANMARALLKRAVRDKADPLPDHADDWISNNVTASSPHAVRVMAILRYGAGVGSESDRESFELAAQSALEGKTIDTAPAAEPESGTETVMYEPTDTRTKLMEYSVFNLAGLPPALRDPGNQVVYIDAVVQAVALLGHPDAVDWAGATAAILLLDGSFDPRDQRFFAHAQRAVAELSSSAKEGGTIPIDDHNLEMFGPDPDSTQRIQIFRIAFEILQKHSSGPVFLQSFALAGRKAVDTYDEHLGDVALMAPVVNATYDTHVTTAASGGGSGSGVANVELPPLSDPQGYNDEIEPDNVRAVSTIYVSYQLEFALKASSRILELFVAGLLPISASDGNARELDNLYWDQDDLLDESSRRSVYARVLGAPGGELAFDIQPNTEFNTLLMRVVSAVSEFEREQSVLTHFDNAARGRRYQSTSGEFVRKAVRDFAANVSLRGWAGTAFTAERMAKQVRRVMRILNLPSVRNAFGVTTPWQVIERVSQREFGITVNTVLHRTLAVETQKIMKVIADNHTIWSGSVTGKPLFSEALTQAGQVRGIVVEGDLSLDSTHELMVACQHFRAVTGVGDALLDEYSAPVETMPQPSLPDMSAIGGGGGGMAVPGVDISGLTQLRDMVNSGQTPNLEQLRAMLPGF